MKSKKWTKGMKTGSDGFDALFLTSLAKDVG